MAMSKSVKVAPCMFVLALTVSEITAFEIFTLESRSRSRSTIFAMLSLDGKYRKTATVVLFIYARALAVLDILTCQIIDHQKVGQGYREQFSQ